MYDYDGKKSTIYDTSFDWNAITMKGRRESSARERVVFLSRVHTRIPRIVRQDKASRVPIASAFCTVIKRARLLRRAARRADEKCALRGCAYERPSLKRGLLRLVRFGNTFSFSRERLDSVVLRTSAFGAQLLCKMIKRPIYSTYSGQFTG